MNGIEHFEPFGRQHFDEIFFAQTVDAISGKFFSPLVNKKPIFIDRFWGSTILADIAVNTEQTYCQWILRYIYHFGGKTHPKRLGAKDVEQFLSHLATEAQVSASTQRQVLKFVMSAKQKVFEIS